MEVVGAPKPKLQTLLLVLYLPRYRVIGVMQDFFYPPYYECLASEYRALVREAGSRHGKTPVV